MKMFIKDIKNRYLKVDDIDVVFTEDKSEAYNFSDMSVDDLTLLKKHIENAYDTELETIFE